MDVDLTAAAATLDRRGGASVAAVRAWWRVHRPPPSLGKRLDTAYMVAITAGIVGALLYGTASSALARVVRPDTVPAWGPAVALVALVLAAQWGTWHGPVVYTPPDVGFLLGAPLSRIDLARGRLLRALVAGAGAGAAFAAVALVGLGGEGRGVAFAPSAGLVAGLALAGVMAVAVAARVQCSAPWSRAAALTAWAAAPVAAGLIAVGRSGAAGRDLALWSGPWGWAVRPVAGASTAAAVGALIALAALTAWSTAGALRAFGPCPTERHAARAQAHEGAVASLAAFDARSARLALRSVAGTDPSRSRRRLRPPRSPALAVPWRGAIAVLRAPARTLAGALLAAGAAALAVAEARHPAAVAVAALGTYAGAGLLLEPLRLEIDRPSTAQTLLLRPFGRVLGAHAVVPAAVTTFGAAAGATVAGAGVDRGAALAVAVVAVAPVVALCAALSARRGGRMPVSVLATTAADPTGGGLAVAWMLLWPGLGAALATFPVVLVARAQSAGAELPAALAFALLAALALAGALRSSAAPR